jgi:hypothetical protein
MTRHGRFLHAALGASALVSSDSTGIAPCFRSAPSIRRSRNDRVHGGKLG